MAFTNLERVSTSEARDNLAELLNRVAFGRERLIVAKNGKDVAALISMQDLEWLKKLEDLVDVSAAFKALAESGELDTIENLRKKLAP